jgi:hypothetical protein
VEEARLTKIYYVFHFLCRIVWSLFRISWPFILECTPVFQSEYDELDKEELLRRQGILLKVTCMLNVATLRPVPTPTHL